MSTEQTTAALTGQQRFTADWPTYYGITLTDIGEDGDIVILGHHDDQRRVIAALNRHARKFWGEESFVSPWDGVMSDIPESLHKRWGRFITRCRDAMKLPTIADPRPASDFISPRAVLRALGETE